MRMMERVAQTNACSCMAAVAAMIAGCCIEKVFEAIGHDGTHPERHFVTADGFRPIRLTEIAGFLAGRGFLLGACAEQFPVPPELIAGRLVFEIPVTISGHHPALLIVQGVNHTHAVFWTGLFVLDPRPDRQGTYDLDDYRILQWWPVVKVA